MARRYIIPAIPPRTEDPDALRQYLIAMQRAIQEALSEAGDPEIHTQSWVPSNTEMLTTHHSRINYGSATATPPGARGPVTGKRIIRFFASIKEYVLGTGYASNEAYFDFYKNATKVFRIRFVSVGSTSYAYATQDEADRLGGTTADDLIIRPDDTWHIDCYIDNTIGAGSTNWFIPYVGIDYIQGGVDE